MFYNLLIIDYPTILYHGRIPRCQRGDPSSILGERIV